jgi:hypothetical protein
MRKLVPRRAGIFNNKPRGSGNFDIMGISEESPGTVVEMSSSTRAGRGDNMPEGETGIFTNIGLSAAGIFDKKPRGSSSPICWSRFAGSVGRLDNKPEGMSSPTASFKNRDRRTEIFDNKLEGVSSLAASCKKLDGRAGTAEESVSRIGPSAG